MSVAKYSPNQTLLLNLKRRYFTARSDLLRGCFNEVTIIPTGNKVEKHDFLNRLTSSIRSCKNIDWCLLVLECSDQGIYHVHGFIHQKDVKNKLLKLHRDPLLTYRFNKDAFNPEIWMAYMSKDSHGTIRYQNGKFVAFKALKKYIN